MPKLSNVFLVALALVATAGFHVAFAQSTEPGVDTLKQAPAIQRRDAARHMMLGAARAGRRVVAVGDHGVILLSDDDGKTFRQATAVPTRAMLNSVAFADDKHGWAVGHWGSIVATEDGGETWVLQRTDTATDRPLFSVYFSDAHHGVAVGLWSLVLVTHDGGAHWQPMELPPPPGGGRADRNLFSVFGDAKGVWFVAAERGTVLRSADRGATWNYLDTGYKGSLWAGAALEDGTLVVAGLRGSAYYSEDGGRTWSASQTNTKSSVTSIAEICGRVVAVGLDGTFMISDDQGRHFQAIQLAALEGRASLNSVLASEDGRALLFSEQGPLAVALPKNSATRQP